LIALVLVGRERIGARIANFLPRRSRGSAA
jgi:hypothetical protein